jgi:hypothetical protein
MVEKIKRNRSKIIEKNNNNGYAMIKECPLEPCRI